MVAAKRVCVIGAGPFAPAPGITEGFAPVLSRRSATLHSRMKQILNDDDLSGLDGALVTPGRAQTGR